MLFCFLAVLPSPVIAQSALPASETARVLAVARTEFRAAGADELAELRVNFARVLVALGRCDEAADMLRDANAPGEDFEGPAYDALVQDRPACAGRLAHILATALVVRPPGDAPAHLEALISLIESPAVPGAALGRQIAAAERYLGALASPQAPEGRDDSVAPWRTRLRVADFFRVQPRYREVLRFYGAALTKSRAGAEERTVRAFLERLAEMREVALMRAIVGDVEDRDLLIEELLAVPPAGREELCGPVLSAVELYGLIARPPAARKLDTLADALAQHAMAQRCRARP